MTVLPYEIIYLIFKHVDNFDTAKQFLYLNKTFYVNYAKTKNFRLSLVYLSFKKALTFLHNLLEMTPEQIKVRIEQNSNQENQEISNVYKLLFLAIYKKLRAMSHQSTLSLINAIITSNPCFVLDVIQISIKDDTFEVNIPVMSKLFMFRAIYPYRYINNQIRIMENNFIDNR